MSFARESAVADKKQESLSEVALSIITPEQTAKFIAELSAASQAMDAKSDKSINLDEIFLKIKCFYTVVAWIKDPG